MIDFLPVPAVLEQVVPAVAEHHLFEFRLSSPLTADPGQFVELSVPGVGSFPVSTAAWGLGPDRLQACVRRAGRVTSALFQLQPGAVVGIRGPFGNGFPMAEFKGRDVLLVAGGLGIVPLRGLLQALLAQPGRGGEIVLLYGSREPETLLFRGELAELAAARRLRVRFSVDFASELPWSPQAYVCKVGLVTSLLQELRFDPEATTAAVCGPPALYGCVLEELAALGVPAARIFATLERRMQCGVGQCCHCVTAGRFICRDGPVFSLEELRRMSGSI